MENNIMYSKGGSGGLKKPPSLLKDFYNDTQEHDADFSSYHLCVPTVAFLLPKWTQRWILFNASVDALRLNATAVSNGECAAFIRKWNGDDRLLPTHSEQDSPTVDLILRLSIHGSGLKTWCSSA